MDYRRPSGWYQTKDSTTAQHLDSPNTASPEPGATASVDGFRQIACSVVRSLESVFSNQSLAAWNFNISIFYLKLCEAWYQLFPPHVTMVSVRHTIFYLRGKLVNLYSHPAEFQSDQTGMIGEWWTEIIYIQVHLNCRIQGSYNLGQTAFKLKRIGWLNLSRTHLLCCGNDSIICILWWFAWHKKVNSNTWKTF